MGASLKAESLVKKSKFHGHRVLCLINTDPGDKGTEAPCFGYNAHTGEVKRPKHVFRFFGHRLIVEGAFSTDDFGAYKLDLVSQFIISGLTMSQPPENQAERELAQ